ncbi:hypothetical protein [Bacillus cereus]|uniref:hypothetical protein n=1 Tax=Bacillus cereus TaxID=1396 RepID=UPI001375213D|nr:hypothetical protein [Bacillus cereus]
MRFDLTSLSSIAAFTTSMVSLGTLWQVRKQRWIANQPDTFIKNKESTIKIGKKNLVDDHIELIDLMKFNHDMHLDLFNIGLGPAKDILVEWNFDKSFLKKMQQMDKPNIFMLEMVNDSKDLAFGCCDRLIHLVDDLNSQIAFILPYKSSEEATKLKLPKSFITICTMYFTLLPLIHAQGRREHKERPYINLKLTYKDIYNKTYLRKYRITYQETNYFEHPSEMEGSFEVIKV